MTGQERRDIYTKLPAKMRDFVDFYVESVLKIPKYTESLPQKSFENKEETELQNEQQKKVGNIGKLIDKKYNQSSKIAESTLYFENLNPEFLDFLFPEYETNLKDGQKMKDMQKAVEKIVSSILAGEKICIYSDYDCDGVPGISMMRDFFEMINYKNIFYYIPHRHTEGYGLNQKALDKIKEENVSLIITIDLGITNIQEIEYANNLEMEVIVTDHHLPIETLDGQVLPKAFAILNHKQNSCKYEDKNLCGSGVLFKLICEIISYAQKNNLWEIKKGSEKWFLDLVGIATIADMVPLLGENRILANYGLCVLKKTKRQGLRTLLKNSKINLEKLNEDDIAFSIAPRVNAASRMDHALSAFEMFSGNTKNSIDAAHYLESLNSDRKESVASIMKKVQSKLSEKLESGNLPDVIVVGESSWGAGVLGIVASNILEKFGRTTFVWGGESDGEFKGSCRSLGDVHVVKLMTLNEKLFTHFGGHESAGGFAIKFKDIHFLEKELNKNYSKSLICQRDEIENKKQEKNKVGGLENNSIKIDLEDVTSEFLSAISLLGPFGIGNPKPYFTISQIQNFEIKRFGKKNEHLKIILENRVAKREAISFFVDKQKEEDIKNRIHALQFTLEQGYMRGVPRLKIL